ncbi:MAG: winged helix-turn-helix domain-containing protein [Steroidobacteraceae bacterium]
MPNDMHGIDSEVYLVGDLRVDVGQQRVTRASIEINLPNLSFQLLVALIRVAPNVLSNDLLMARVWPGLIVSPETVTKRVNLLREALGDDTQDPHYIAGVRSRGYRLAAAVSAAHSPAQPVGDALSAAVAVTQPDELPTGNTVTTEPQEVATRPRRIWWLVSSVLLAAIIAIAIGVRTVNKSRVADAQSISQNSLGDTAAIGARARTVAVLPFDNISADPADAYLAQGLPEMILNRLSQIEGLSVIARTSSFALSTNKIDSREIGRRLNSGYLIGGSVQREGDRLRVTAQLVDSSAGTLLWSAHFDRGLHDIFNVEDEIADHIAGALSGRLGKLEPKPPAGVRSANLEAYLAYLRGRSLLGRFSVAESESAAPYFEKAIALDPNFAAAYASLYESRLQAAHLRHEDLAPVRQRFRPLIDRALTIDPKSGAAYFARAMWAHAPFESRNADFRRGIALDPSNGRGLTAYAEFLDPDDFGWVQAGGDSGDYPAQRAEAKRILQRALQIDPMSPGAHFDVATGSLDEVGAAALEQKMQSVLELDPDFVPALFQVAKYRWAFHGRLADAVHILEHAITLDPRNPEPRRLAMGVYLDLGDEQAARAVVAALPKDAHDPSMFIYAGDWRAAGRAAYESGSGDDCDSGPANRAVRDYALTTGELSRAIAFIKATPYYEGDLAAHLGVCNIETAIMLSQLLDAQGHASAAQGLRRAAVSWLNANGAKYAVGSHGLAEALVLDGRTDEALDTLANDFRAGDYGWWWYVLKYDPVWQPMHGDRRFQAIANDVQRYVDGQRKELEDLRRRGVVPDAQRLNHSAPISASK